MHEAHAQHGGWQLSLCAASGPGLSVRQRPQPAPSKLQPSSQVAHAPVINPFVHRLAGSQPAAIGRVVRAVCPLDFYRHAISTRGRGLATPQGHSGHGVARRHAAGLALQGFRVGNAWQSAGKADTQGPSHVPGTVTAGIPHGARSPASEARCSECHSATRQSMHHFGHNGAGLVNTPLCRQGVRPVAWADGAIRWAVQAQPPRGTTAFNRSGCPAASPQGCRIVVPRPAGPAPFAPAGPASRTQARCGPTGPRARPQRAV
jgi:hypothetical protein